MKFLSIPSVPSLAVADGATSPTPDGFALLWSTTTDCMMYWDGAAWRCVGSMQPGNAYGKGTAPVSYSAARTLTIADLLNGMIRYTGAAATLTLPTGTLVDAGVVASMPVNTAFDYIIINTGSGAATIAAGTAHSIVGATAVTNGTSARWRCCKTAANTFVSYRIG